MNWLRLSRYDLSATAAGVALLFVAPFTMPGIGLHIAPPETTFLAFFSTVESDACISVALLGR
jgi:hypothetical protein